MSVPVSSHDAIHPDLERSMPRRDSSHINSRLSIGSNSDYQGIETSRTKPSKMCVNCGRIKTERFCECRKNGTPKNSQKGSNTALRSV
jgi:hypothetical protein